MRRITLAIALVAWLAAPIEASASKPHLTIASGRAAILRAEASYWGSYEGPTAPRIVACGRRSATSVACLYDVEAAEPYAEGEAPRRRLFSYADCAALGRRHITVTYGLSPAASWRSAPSC